MQLVDKTLPMSGFEPWISGVGSDLSTNWATTTAQVVQSLIPTTYWPTDIKHAQCQLTLKRNYLNWTHLKGMRKLGLKIYYGPVSMVADSKRIQKETTLNEKYTWRGDRGCSASLGATGRGACWSSAWWTRWQADRPARLLPKCSARLKEDIS